jgi:hypothetical protein
LATHFPLWVNECNHTVRRLYGMPTLCQDERCNLLMEEVLLTKTHNLLTHERGRCWNPR